jgi:hypothetical protein
MTLSENALKLTGVHLYFANFSGEWGLRGRGGRGYTPSRTLPLNPPHFETPGFATVYTVHPVCRYEGDNEAPAIYC